tara:strand:+ start:1327 stop:1983 length:657 start_codon:yes stop_codon:yes gene_type:complete
MIDKYKLIIFDWDGTLMDSVDRIVVCMKKALVDLGYREPKYEEIQDLIGLSLEKTIQKLFKDIDQRGIDDISAQYKKYWQSNDVIDSKLFLNVQKVIIELSKQGYLLAIATGKSRNGLSKSLANSNLEHFFHATRCADETKSKPHPLMIEELISELKVNKNQALMIGDTEFDMEMAKNAGIKAVGVSYGVHDKQRLSKSGAEYIMTDMIQLLDYLKDR